MNSFSEFVFARQPVAQGSCLRAAGLSGQVAGMGLIAAITPGFSVGGHA